MCNEIVGISNERRLQLNWNQLEKTILGAFAVCIFISLTLLTRVHVCVCVCFGSLSLPMSRRAWIKIPNGIQHKRITRTMCNSMQSSEMESISFIWLPFDRSKSPLSFVYFQYFNANVIKYSHVSLLDIQLLHMARIHCVPHTLTA